MSIRGHEARVVGRDAGFEANRPDNAWRGHTTQIPTLRLINGGNYHESFCYRRNRIHRLCGCP